MSNLAKTLKDEIARIAKRESNKLVSAQAKTVSHLKRTVAAMKKQITELEKSQKPVEKALARIQPESPPDVTSEKADGKWFTGQGIRSLRKRLGLSQQQLEKLLGVSQKMVAKWERKKGKIALRPRNVQALTEIREMGKKQAMDKLGLDADKKEKATSVTAKTTPAASPAPAKKTSTAKKAPAKKQSVAGKSYTAKDIMALRKRLGLSQRDLAKKIGVSQRGISHWETKPGTLQLRPNSVKALEKLEG